MSQEFIDDWTQNRFFPSRFSITYPIDRYDEYDPIIKNYKFPHQLTASDVLYIIQHFYRENISHDDIVSQPNNPYSVILLQQLEEGFHVTRGDLLGGANFFVGLRRNVNNPVFYLRLAVKISV